MEEMISNSVKNLMAAIFGEDCPKCYSYIIVGNNGEEKKVWLTEAVHEVLETLLLRKGKNDSQAWARYKRIIELRFGLVDGKAITLREIGQELGGITGASVRQMEARALSILRRPSRSKCLRRFLVPPPEEIYHLRQKIYRLQDDNQSLSEHIKTLEAMLKGFGVKDPEVKAANLAIEQEQFKSLRVRFPNDRVWHGLRRHFAREGGIIHPFAKLEEMMASGEIRQVRNLGVKSEAFLRDILETLRKESKIYLQQSIV